MASLAKSVLMAGVFLAGAMAVPAVLQAQDGRHAYAQVSGEATPPLGWVEFCGTREGRRDCEVTQLRSADAVLDERRWRELLTINATVNRDIEPVTDIDHWGVAERWSYPTDGRGDCEDYVLEKRRQLIAAGWHRQSLLITVVRDKKGDGHAILTVKTDRGDFILDNQEPKVKLWTETGYRFIKRQSQEHPNRWVSLGNVDTNIITARSR
ncbi:MAG: transglutaminase-like cysteine peptidase [Beijerinckiaceae bacterium]